MDGSKNLVDQTMYFCERCRRKYFPTDAEKADDEQAQRVEAEYNARIDRILEAVWIPVKILIVVAAVFGGLIFLPPLVLENRCGRHRLAVPVAVVVGILGTFANLVSYRNSLLKHDELM